MTTTPPYLSYPLYLPQDVADRLLTGIDPKPTEHGNLGGYCAFGTGAYHFAGAAIPRGMILSRDLLAGRLVVLVGEQSHLMKPFLHRVRSGIEPCRNELVLSEGATKASSSVTWWISAGWLVTVLEYRIEHFRDADGRPLTAVLIVFKLIEALPYVPAIEAPPAARPTSGDEGDDGADEEGGQDERWKALDVIAEQCRLLRDENRRRAAREKNAVPHGLDARAWRYAVSSVLAFCNDCRLPKVFSVAWQFVANNNILGSYQRDRELFADQEDNEKTRQRTINLVAALGGPAVEIALMAMIGWDRGANRSAPST
jgi:hypothetical protein